VAVKGQVVMEKDRAKLERDQWNAVQKRFFAEGGVFDRIPLAKGAK